MRELLIYGISACASLFILSYTVHIFIGGLVSERTEIIAIIVTLSIAIACMSWMARDIIKSRQHR